MLYWYALGPGLASVGAGLYWLLRRYRASLGRTTQSFYGFVAGNVQLRVGAIFSRVLASQLSARRYAELSLKRFPAKISIPSVQNFQLGIDNAYVKLLLLTGEQTTWSDRDLLRSESDKSLVSIMIFGEPGSGKSTLTRKLFRDACRFLYNAPGSRPMPVHIELKAIRWSECAESAASPGDWLQQQVSREADSVRGIHSSGFMYSAFARGQGVLLFLDGLDEVPSDYLALACDAIMGAARDLAGLGGRSRIVVTGRSQLRAILQKSFLNSFAESCIVQPFSTADIFAFLKGWPFPPEDRSEEVARIFSAIQSSSSLQEMCTNPLVLSMYVARDQLYVSRAAGRPVRLPDTRTEFYQEILNELLLFRRGEQIESAPVGSQIKRQRERLLGQISLVHLQDRDQPANSISWRLAVRMAKDLLALQTEADAERELRSLSIETGIFSEERRKETLRFLHLTLCEFLAAKELRESDVELLSRIVQAVVDDERESRTHRLLEVAIFAASLVGRAHRMQIIQDMQDAPGGAPPALLLRIVHEDVERSNQMLVSALQCVVSAGVRSTSERGHYRSYIHLLFQCFTGRQPAQSPLSGSLSIRDVVRRLVDAEKVATFEDVFPSYVSVSPDLAVSEAKARGASTNQILAIIVEALQEPSVVSYATEQIYEDPGLWAVALAEAALRYPLVAQMLGTSSARGTNRGTIGEADASPPGWLSLECLSNTLYGEVMNLATAHTPIDAGFPMSLSLLARYGADRLRASIGSDNTMSTQQDLLEVFNLGDQRSSRLSNAAGQEDTLFVIAHPGYPIDFWGAYSTLGIELDWSDSRSARVRGRIGAGEYMNYDLGIANPGIPLALFISACMRSGRVRYLPDLTLPGRLYESEALSEFMPARFSIRGFLARRRARATLSSLASK